MDLTKLACPQYHVVRTRGDLEEALALVLKEYKRRGYVPKGYKSKLRISLFNALPSTTTFVVKEKGVVLGGVTLIPDSPMGLPMDKLYAAELDRLRKAGRRIAEVSQLSIDSSLTPRSLFSMFNFNKLIFVFRLFKLVLYWGLTVDRLTDFCIAVNPKHQYLYKFLGFEPIGPLRHYGSVNRAPALALRLDLTTCQRQTKRREGLYKIFFGQKPGPEAFDGKFRMNTEDLRHFFVEKSDLFLKATPGQLNYLKQCYPGQLEGLIQI